MFAPDQYQLLDFGRGRKLERFGNWILDRPAAGSERSPAAHPELWKSAHARFHRHPADGGRWQPVTGVLPESWDIVHGSLTLRLKPTPFGHLGLFPEQAPNWDWLQRRVRHLGCGVRILNLFAYTGGSSLTAAAAGAEVVHVDAARNVVGWARQNAALSQLAETPVRWIAEDARRFVRRELRRGSRYDAVVLDPPSFGRGPKGEQWKLDQHLADLLADCGRLTSGRRGFILLSCHSPGWGAAEVTSLLTDTFQDRPGRVEAYPLRLRTPDGRCLPSGVSGRWVAAEAA